MDLYSKDDDDQDAPEDADGDHDGDTDECEEIAGDIIEAVKSGDKAALAAALKQFRHYEDSESEPEEKHGKGLLIALGSPKKG